MGNSLHLPRVIVVDMPDGSRYPVIKLLTLGEDNVKLAKSEKIGDWRVFGLSLAPNGLSGYNVCPEATEGCKRACIYDSGQAFFSVVKPARIAKTRAWFQNRDEFREMFCVEIERALRLACRKRERVAVRLNVFSDISWEKVWPDIFTRFEAVRFYDYTKIVQRALAHARGKFPRNYHLTFSRSETNEQHCLDVLHAGGNVAVVFNGYKQRERSGLPARWHGYDVIDGDVSDLRFHDPKGVVVGLYAKGHALTDRSGFAVHTGLTRTNKRVVMSA